MSTSTLYEKEWLQMASDGDELAFTHLFHAYKFKLYGFISKLTGSPATAEDVVQDVFLKLWKDRKSLRDVDSFGSYLFRMAQNHAINGFRKMAREENVIRQLHTDEAPAHSTPQSHISLKETRELLHRAIQQLPPRQKAIYLLSREEGVKHEEIARRLHITTGTVKNHMIQALRTLRETLSRHPHSLEILLLPCLVFPFC
ncbi:RNA polymerase sigma factor [Chitinophaga rhizosphaerae]|uniref:RNA polymerase sigma factor n=1 Tax=Chitinophaga rhizosphaerae TaxID=1864947 RepID=UPI000F8041A0|nr:RNA polymerase sigma-70 factor [Chitinophaga rhizosphaerae]